MDEVNLSSQTMLSSSPVKKSNEIHLPSPYQRKEPTRDSPSKHPDDTVKAGLVATTGLDVGTAENVHLLNQDPNSNSLFPTLEGKNKIDS